VELRKVRPVASIDQPDPRSDYGVRIYYGITGEAREQYPFRLTGPLKTGKAPPYSVFTRK
jgi:hypothetical protein